MVVSIGASWLVASKAEGKRNVGVWLFMLSNAGWLA